MSWAIFWHLCSCSVWTAGSHQCLGYVFLQFLTSWSSRAFAFARLQNSLHSCVTSPAPVKTAHDESSSHRTHRICCCSSEASHSHGCFYCTVDEIEHRWVLNEQVYLVNVFMLRSRAMENRIFSTCELVFTSVWFTTSRPVI